MANYLSQTVVQPTIPNACMTSLERWLLEQLFEHEDDGGERTYFFASESVADVIDGADRR